jgi:imidazolonepropionase-like amidohydrolase
VTRAATVAAAALPLLAAKPPEPRPPLALVDVAVVDVESGRVEPHRTVTVAAGKITSIGDAGKSVTPAGAEVFDASGMFLIPGLWDMHVHTGDPSYLRLLVANGVTGARDMGGGAAGANDGCESIAPKQLIAWRREVSEGDEIGPRLILSGLVASGVDAKTQLAVRTAKEAGRAVKELHDLGVDFVAVDESLPPEGYAALAPAAHDAGLPFAGDLPAGKVTLLAALAAGQRSIEHLRDPLLPCSTADREELLRFFHDAAWRPADVAWGERLHADCPAALTALASGATWITPMLVVERANVRVDDPEFLKDAHRGLLPLSVRQGFNAYVARKRSQPEAGRRGDRARWEAQGRLVRRMQGAGVHLLAGTDAPCDGSVPGFSLHEELAALVEAGLSPLDALRSATSNPAAYLARTAELGSIAVGKQADLVLLAANPLTDIHNTRDIEAVVLDGRLLRRTALDALLDSVKQPTEGHPQRP